MRTKIAVALVASVLGATLVGALVHAAAGTEDRWMHLGGWASANGTSRTTPATFPHVATVAGALVIHTLWHPSTFRIVDIRGSERHTQPW